MPKSGWVYNRGLKIVTLLSVCNLPLLLSCDRSPREPQPPLAPESAAQAGESASSSGGVTEEACVVPLADPPPPPAQSIEVCPEDPDGRPSMPMGTVTFPDAPRAPGLQVERALTTAHRNHGLMYRSELSDDQGMLFTWEGEGARSFWMRNTCLALDMLFVDLEGKIVGILEQVPPMNEQHRRVACPAAHVLEVRAGWTRQYGVVPGQQIAISDRTP